MRKKRTICLWCSLYWSLKRRKTLKKRKKKVALWNIATREIMFNSCLLKLILHCYVKLALNDYWWRKRFLCVAPHELTEEEKQQILHSEEFVTFFDHSSRIMERALSEQVDVFFDYSGRDLQDKEGWGESLFICYQMWNVSGVWCWNRVCFRESQAGAKLSLNRQFEDERWSKHRVVTCLDWSPQVLDHANFWLIVCISLNTAF